MDLEIKKIYFILEQLEKLVEEDISSTNKILIPRKIEERKRKIIANTYKRIQKYIENGSEGNLSLWGTLITSLPDNLTHVGGQLYLRDSKILKLPNNLKVDGELNLMNTEIMVLPDNLNIGKNLYIQYTKIISIPKNLKIGGDLYMGNRFFKKI